MKRIEPYTKKEYFTAEAMMKKSLVIASFVTWVKAIEEYHNNFKRLGRLVA